MRFSKNSFYGIGILCGCDSEKISPPSSREVAVEGSRKEFLYTDFLTRIHKHDK